MKSILIALMICTIAGLGAMAGSGAIDRSDVISGPGAMAGSDTMTGSDTIIDVIDLLPPDNIPPGWKGADKHKIFAGDALYRHINGGAELYHKHGFAKLSVKDYVRGELEAVVEIYDMGSSKGAEGVFIANTAGLETDNKFGEACSISELQILFRRERFYISVTCFEINEELQAAISALATSVDKNILQHEP